MSLDLKTLSVNELHTLIEAAELSYADCADKEALQQRAAEAMEKAPQETAAALKTQTSNTMQIQIEKKRRVLEEVKEEMRELLEEQDNGVEPPEGLEQQLKEEIIFLEDQIHKLEDSVNMQSKVDKLRQRLEEEQQKLAELEAKEADMKDLPTSALDKPEETAKRGSVFNFDTAQLARDKHVLEDSIARIQENIAQQVLIEDLEANVLETKNAAHAMEREVKQCKNAVEKSKLKQELTKLNAAAKRAERALYEAQEATVIELFGTWDHDGSGSVSCDELKKIFLALGLKEAAIDVMFKAIDANGNGEIELQEFIDWTFAQK
eukprot:CAMPEP_0197659462 /NCGR_PEP_ID=MMETSP1338-20131121/47737_1 /TAXON_ID=43686 ORGANISM="Pelagodinium beii, Strain RCC1491" /NCGR_SAMPLE_ID=MMETSP1338 /ASSEMBLY_ACC=CAM_ASM_000754 /LENGTH=320 /DNA_ID=CAMNT_0043236399 /DNA_START=62 /DNA_END=1024 /DNA_ORIENTATION=+